MNVVALDQNEDALTRLSQELTADSNLISLVGDVAGQETTEAAVARALECFGRLDGIVSNAGIFQVAPLSETTLDQWRKVLDVNLTASFLLARAGEEALRAARGSSVLMASTRALMSEPNTFAYSVSRAGSGRCAIAWRRALRRMYASTPSAQAGYIRPRMKACARRTMRSTGPAG